MNLKSKLDLKTFLPHSQNTLVAQSRAYEGARLSKFDRKCGYWQQQQRAVRRASVEGEVRGMAAGIFVTGSSLWSHCGRALSGLASEANHKVPVLGRWLTLYYIRRVKEE